MSQQWLLLLHQIPPSPAYFRAKVLRKLNQLGALPIKNSAYLLPENAETMEDLEWLQSEITHQQGEAWLFRVEALAPLSDASLRESFRGLRESDYTQLLDPAVELLRSIRQTNTEPETHESAFRKLKQKFDEVRRIDFFGARGREEVENVMESINAALHGAARQPVPKPGLKDLTNRIWVTRRGVKVDRIATAWLIRRFIDPAARIRFVDPDGYAPAGGEIRFDMFEGEFTHEGDQCTFEVLLEHLGIRDAALNATAQIVHDIDLKDNKYQRPETSGIAVMINGIAALYAADERRVEEGARLFESAYAALK